MEASMQEASPGAARAREPRRSARRLLLALAAIVAVVIAGSIVAIESTRTHARDLVVAYLDAIADGDAAAANAMAADGTGLGVPGDDSLEDAVPLADPWVADEGETTFVIADEARYTAERFEVRYTIDGTVHEDVMDVETTGGRWPSETYALRGSLASNVRIITQDPVGTLPIRVGGQALDLVSAAVLSVPLYPATYAVAPEAGPLVTADPVEVEVGSETAEVVVEAMPTAELAVQAAARAQEVVDRCLARATPILSCDSVVLVSGAAAEAVAWSLEAPVSFPAGTWVPETEVVILASYVEEDGQVVQRRLVTVMSVGVDAVGPGDASLTVLWRGPVG